MTPCWGSSCRDLKGRLRTEAEGGRQAGVGLAGSGFRRGGWSRLCLLRGSGDRPSGLRPGSLSPGTSDQMAGLGDSAWFLSQVPPWEQLWTRPGRTVYGTGHQPEPEPVGKECGQNNGAHFQNIFLQRQNGLG